MSATVLPDRARSSDRPRAWRKQGLPYLLMLPCVVLIGGFLVYPLIDQVYLSLTHWKLLYSPTPAFVGPSTYQRLLGDPEFWAKWLGGARS